MAKTNSKVDTENEKVTLRLKNSMQFGKWIFQKIFWISWRLVSEPD